MGDKSPKAAQKQKSQAAAKTASSNKQKQQAAAVRKPVDKKK